MNGMEELTIEEPEDKALMQMEKQQLVSVIIDQQREISRLRRFLESERKDSRRYKKGYRILSNVDWMVASQQGKKEWHDAQITPPGDASVKWVCSFGGTETTAFYDGQVWWTDDHQKINVKVWQHLPHYTE